MNRLSAEQILESYYFANNDTCSEGEEDVLELRLDPNSDEEPVSDDDPDYLTSNNIQSPNMAGIVDSIAAETNLSSILYGRQTKTKPKPPFEWFSNPNCSFPNGIKSFEAKIIDELKEEKSIIVFFRRILDVEMMTSILNFTNLRISLINTSKFLNVNYRKQVERLISKKITLDELFAFVGLMILFGLTGKSNVSIEEIWSDKSAPFDKRSTDKSCSVCRYYNES